MKRPFWKLTGLVALMIIIVVILCAGLVSRADKAAQQAAIATRQTLRDQGFKTDLEDFKVTTEPAMRARMAALLALKDSPKLDANGDSLDLRPFVSNGVAPVLWQQEALPLDKTILHWQDLRAALDKDRDILDTACQAALAGSFQSDMDLKNHVNPWNFPISNIYNLARSLGDRALLELHDGHPDAVWTNLLAATRLDTAWQVDPTPFSHLLRYVMTDADLALTWQMLQYGHWSEMQLSALQNEWESTDLFANLPETMSLERMENIGYCQRLAQSPPSVLQSLLHILNESFRNPLRACQDAGDYFDMASYGHRSVFIDEKNLLLFFRDRELDLRHAIQSPSWAQIRTQPGITNSIPFKFSISVLNQTFGTLDYAMADLVTGAVVVETERRMLITAIALERYRVKYGTYPKATAALVPEFLKTVPLDYMDGQPLRYRLADNGRFLLYSVGLDCVDDGGKQPAADARRFGFYGDKTITVLTNVDIVWPRPATP